MVGPGDQDERDGLTVDDVDDPPLAVEDPEACRRPRPSWQPVPARGSRSSRGSGSRCGPVRSRRRGSARADPRPHRCRRAVRARRRGRRRPPATASASARRTSGHVDLVDGEERRSEDGEHADDHDEHTGRDPPASESTAAFGAPDTDPALAESRLDSRTGGILREQRVAGPVVVDEDRRRIGAAAEFVVEVHGIGKVVVATDRDRGQTGIRRRRRVRVVVAERRGQFGEDVAARCRPVRSRRPPIRFASGAGSRLTILTSVNCRLASRAWVCRSVSFDLRRHRLMTVLPRNRSGGSRCAARDPSLPRPAHGRAPSTRARRRPSRPGRPG